MFLISRWKILGGWNNTVLDNEKITSVKRIASSAYYPCKMPQKAFKGVFYVICDSIYFK
jgi:hypothetical protein